jgi:hypothetical protein
VPNQPAGDEIAQGCGAGAEQRERHRRGQDLPNRSRRWVGPMQWSERLEQGGKPTDAAAIRRRSRDAPCARTVRCLIKRRNWHRLFRRLDVRRLVGCETGKIGQDQTQQFSLIARHNIRRFPLAQVKRSKWPIRLFAHDAGT